MQRELLYRDIQKLERHASLTVSGWLLGIPAGTDRLPDVEGAGSMSRFGAKTEKVGPRGAIDAGIFEYRGAQGTKIPLEDWPKFAEQQFKLILRINEQ